MELFEKIITQRITSTAQLSEQEQGLVAADPELRQLIVHNAEFAGAQAQAALPPDMGQMLNRVSLAESILQEPARLNLLEQLFGNGWQLKSVGTLAACAVLVAALFAIPGMLSGQQPGNDNRPPQLADNGRVETLLAHSSVGTWLEYSVGEGLNEPERELLQEKLQLAVSENSADIAAEPQVRLLADGTAYSVYIPELASADPRIDVIDNSIRRVERFSLQRRSNRLFVEDALPGGEIRVIRHADSDIAFPAGMSDQQLLAVLAVLAPHVPQSGLPADPGTISGIVSLGFAEAGFDGSWLSLPDNGQDDASFLAQPGISEDDAVAIARFEQLELRLGNRLENSLALYELDEDQIETYRRDLEHELQLHLLLPSNWHSMQRSELDDYIYSRVLMQCRVMGIDTLDIRRDQIVVYVNDEPADSEQLPDEPQRLLVEIR